MKQVWVDLITDVTCESGASTVSVTLATSAGQMRLRLPMASIRALICYVETSSLDDARILSAIAKDEISYPDKVDRDRAFAIRAESEDHRRIDLFVESHRTGILMSFLQP